MALGNGDFSLEVLESLPTLESRERGVQLKVLSANFRIWLVQTDDLPDRALVVEERAEGTRWRAVGMRVVTRKRSA